MSLVAVIKKISMAKVLFLLLTVSAIVNVLLVFLQIDTSISLDHARSEVDRQRERAYVALKIIRNLMVSSQKNDLNDLKKIASEFSTRGAIVKMGCAEEIEIGEIVFKHSSGKIISVDYFD